MWAPDPFETIFSSSIMQLTESFSIKNHSFAIFDDKSDPHCMNDFCIELFFQVNLVDWNKCFFNLVSSTGTPLILRNSSEDYLFASTKPMRKASKARKYYLWADCVWNRPNNRFMSQILHISQVGNYKQPKSDECLFYSLLCQPAMWMQKFILCLIYFLTNKEY